MDFDKVILGKLQKFAGVFKEARDRNAKEADTVMYLIKFFEEVLQYDPLKGEISKEVAVKERYCDFAIKFGEEIVFLVEAKSAAIKGLSHKHIEQASNYASNSGLEWVLLTSGVEWRLYHLSFGSGIEAEMVFEVDLLEDFDKNPEHVWDLLGLLEKSMVKSDSLKRYWEQKKILSPKTLIRVLLGLPVLMRIRQELNHQAPAMLEIKDVFTAVRDVLSKEALLEADEITCPSKKRKKHRKHHEVEAGAEKNAAAEKPFESGEKAPLQDGASSEWVNPGGKTV